MGAITDAQETYSLDRWPFRWCSAEEARGFVSRMRAGDTRKQIAAEYHVHPVTISRAVVYYLLAVGEYDGDGWKRYKSERKRQARQRFLERVNARDARQAATLAAIREERKTLVSERARRDRQQAAQR